MNYLIAIFLALSQIVILPTISFRWIKEYSLQILIILSVALLVWMKNKWISSFLIWSFILFLMTKAFWIEDAGEQTKYNVNIIAFLNFVNIVLYSVFYYVLHNIKLDRKLIYKTFCFIAIFQTIYVFIQKANLDQFFYSISLWHTPAKKAVSWCVGSWANESLVSWCIALCSPFFLAFKEFRYKLGYILGFVAVCFTQVTAGIVGYILGFLFWLFYRYRKLAVLFIGIVLIIGIYGVSSGKLEYYLQDTHRFQVWKKAIEIWKAGSGNPEILDRKTMTGYGLGSFRILFWAKAPEFRDDGHWAQAHNEYIQILFEQGVIGLGIILGLMWMTFYHFWKSKVGLIPITSLLILSFISIVGFPMRTAIGAIPLISLVLFERELWGEEAI